MIRIYNTYNKVRKVFKKPKLTWCFGKWRNQPGLPVWRRGNIIRLVSHSNYETPRDSVFWKTKYQWSKLGKKRHPFLSKFFKPVYKLPIWLTFYIFNIDVVWKTKYDDYRYEYPPQFTIVFFGLALSFFLHCPLGSDKDDDYWEAILWYINKGNLKEVDEKLGGYFDWNGNELRRRLDKNFLKDNCKNENGIR